MTTALDPADVTDDISDREGVCHIAVHVGPPAGWAPLCGDDLELGSSATDQACVQWVGGYCVTCGRPTCKKCERIERERWR
jgi:hypothetical protein